MALALVNTIPDVCLSGNPIEAVVSTTSRYNTTPRLSKLSFAFGAGAVENNTVTIAFEDENENEYSLVYTFKAIPTAARDFSGFEHFCKVLQTDITLGRFYTISRLESGSLLLTARQGNACFDITFTSQISGTTYNNYSYIAGSEKQFYRIGCNVWVQNLTGTNNEGLSLAGQLFATPGSDNRATFDISPFVANDYANEFVYPDTGADVIRLRNNLRTDYKLEFFEKYFSGGSEKTDNNIETSTLHALSGKISEELLAQYDGLSTTWWAQYQAAKAFLTRQPQMKPVFATQPEKLYHLCYAEYISLRLRATIYYTDNTSATMDISDPFPVEQFDIVEVVANYNQIILPNLNPAKTLNYYELYLDTPNQTATEKKSYKLDTRYFNQNRTFMFRNSLGAYDCIVFSGFFSQENKYERNIVELENTYKESGAIAQKVYQGNSHYLPSLETKLYLQEFYTSSEICELSGDNIYGVVLLDEKQKMWQDRQNIHDISFEYMRTVIDSLFTPLDIIIYIEGLAYSDEGLFSPGDDEIFGIK